MLTLLIFFLLVLVAPPALYVLFQLSILGIAIFCYLTGINLGDK